MFFAPVRTTRNYSPTTRTFDREFERFLSDAFVGKPTSRVNVTEDDNTWTLSFDLPGIAREQLAVNIENAVVRVETSAEAKRQFKAAYELPQAIDAEASSAQLENGVLTLSLAKKKPVSNARTLEIK